MTQQKGKTNGKRNKSAGHSWERSCVSYVKEAGYEHAVTSRSESRSRDAEKVDIINHDERTNGRLPYNIQCKTLSKTCVYPKLLSELPQGGPEINVIFHRQTELVGTRFMTRGEYALLELDDFLVMMKKENDLKLEAQRYRKAFELISNFWDWVPEEEKEGTNEQLKQLGV